MIDFFHLFNEYLLITFYMLSSILQARNEVKYTIKSLFSVSCILGYAMGRHTKILSYVK